MDTKEANILEFICHNKDETLTTTKLSTHFETPIEDLQPILDRLEDQMFIYIGAKTPQGHYYDINPTPRAEQHLGLEPIPHEPLTGARTDMRSLSAHPRTEA